MKKILLTTPLLIMALAEVSFAAPVQIGANNLPLGTTITQSPASAFKPAVKGVIVPNAVESVIFPALTDTHVTASGTNYWNLGDYIAGTRVLVNTGATSVDMTLQVASNGLTCDTQDHALLIDGAVVGNFSIAAGQTSVVQTFPTASLLAGTHTIRLETVRTVAPGCGSAGFTDDVSTLVFNSAALVPTPNYSIQFNTYSDCLNLWLDPVDGMATGNIPVVGPGTVFSGLYDNNNTLGGGFISFGSNYMYKFTVNSSTVDVYAVDPIGSTKTFITSDTWHVAPSCTGVMSNAPTSISAK